MNQENKNEIKVKKPWFRAKRYGFGWYPATWQGWGILLLYVFVNVKLFRDIDHRSHSGSDTLYGFVPAFLFITLLLILICYKTGEKPRWRWGKEDDKIENN